jgi:uncharacterized protein (TIGR03546 family)
MMILIKLIAKIFRILNAEATPKQIAGGMALGMIIGLTPTFSLHNIVVVFLILVIRVNITSAILSMFAFDLIGYGVDPLSDWLGYAILTSTALRPLWIETYNAAIIPFTRFNNTIVMGSFVISLILLYPIFRLAEYGVERYRSDLAAKFQQWRIVKAVKMTRFYKYYQTYRSIMG